MKIKIAKTDDEILNCFPILKDLHKLKSSGFLSRVRRQEKQGFSLVYLKIKESVVSVAGIRLTENLARGKYLYIDDMITKKSERSKGFGNDLLQWIIDLARKNKCSVIKLHSGLDRLDAHRFYLKNKMKITSYHLTLDLDK